MKEEEQGWEGRQEMNRNSDEMDGGGREAKEERGEMLNSQ